MENVVFEQPHPALAREVSCIVSAGGIVADVPTAKLHLQPFGSVVRKCYLNLDYINPRPGIPVPIRRVSYPGPGSNVEVTVTTQLPANLAVGDYVEIYGSDVSNFNSRFKVTDLLPVGFCSSF